MKSNNVSKEFYIMNTWDLLQASMNWFNISNSVNVIHHINRLRKKKHIIVSTGTEKVLDKIQHH